MAPRNWLMSLHSRDSSRAMSCHNSQLVVRISPAKVTPTRHDSGQAAVVLRSYFPPTLPAYSPTATRGKNHKEKQPDHKAGKALVARAIIPLRPALPLLDDLPDMVQTLLNTAAISL